MLPARRAARRHRRQRDGRQADPGLLPEDFRTRARPAARRRGGARRLRRSRAQESAASRRKRSPTASSRSPSRTWRTRSRKFRCSAAMTSPRYALNCFGGAGGQHACLVADALGMTKRADPSVLVAAVGLRHGARRHPRHAPAGDRGSRSARSRSRSLNRHRQAPRRETRATRSPARACPQPTITVHVRAHIRYAGTDTALVGDAGTLADDASGVSRRRTRRASASSTQASRSVVEAVSVEAVGGGAKFREQKLTAARTASCPRPCARTQFFSQRPLARRRHVYTRDQLKPGHKVKGRRHHHRAAPDHRGRGPAGRPNSRRRTIWC